MVYSNNNLKVSIITPAYNCASTIGRCIMSIYEQTYKDIEHIVIDGSSTDSTVEIINTYSNGRSKVISEPDDGIYDAMNKGIMMANGNLIGTLNADDYFSDRNVVEKIVNSFKLKEDIQCVYGNLVFINKQNKIVRKWQSRKYERGLFSKSWTPAHPTFYCRKEIYSEHGMYKSNYKIAADVEFMLRVLEIKKIRSYFMDETMVCMLTGGRSNQGLRSTVIITKEVKRAFRENGLKLNLFKYLLFKMLKMNEYL
jgi:glycosyltransferase involved in cell wall biosynthesis